MQLDTRGAVEKSVNDLADESGVVACEACKVNEGECKRRELWVDGAQFIDAYIT